MYVPSSSGLVSLNRMILPLFAPDPRFSPDCACRLPFVGASVPPMALIEMYRPVSGREMLDCCSGVTRDMLLMVNDDGSAGLRLLEGVPVREGRGRAREPDASGFSRIGLVTSFSS